jgi:hypothetical protein
MEDRDMMKFLGAGKADCKTTIGELAFGSRQRDK